MLIVLGLVFVVMAFLAAFTIYGEVAGVVGLGCIAGGAIILGRSGSTR
jgi:hypothetical protein